MNHSRHMAIVGFGPAGGTLAVLLARAGYEVTIFEQAPQLGPVGAGLLLQPSGQAVLRRLGLLDPIAAASEPIEHLHAVLAGGRTLVKLRYDAAFAGAHAYGVERGLLFETLRKAVEATGQLPARSASECVTPESTHSLALRACNAGATVLLDHAIQSRRETADGVFVVDARGREHGPFEWLAVCDGSRSRLRREVDPHVREHPYEYGAVFASGPCAAARNHLHQTVDGTRRLCGVLPTGSGRATLFWGLLRDRFDSLRTSDFSAFRRDVITLCPLATEIFDEFRCFDQAAFATYRHAAPRTPFTPRTVLVGDAAHAMSPHLGQGANLALADAECLAESLAAESSPAAAFARYSTLRRGQNRFYSRLSRLLTPFFQSPGFLRGLGRNVALPLMSHVPPIRRQMELALAGMKDGWLTQIAAGVQ